MAVTTRLRLEVATRANGCCEYCHCQQRFSCDSFSVEHVLPRARGGGDELRNLALACQGCNNRKYTITTATDPATGERVPLFHPRKDTWSEHFAWSVSLDVIVGLTPIGRATVSKLELNRTAIVNLRRILTSAGEHPPELD